MKMLSRFCGIFACTVLTACASPDPLSYIPDVQRALIIHGMPSDNVDEPQSRIVLGAFDEPIGPGVLSVDDIQRLSTIRERIGQLGVDRLTLEIASRDRAQASHMAKRFASWLDLPQDAIRVAQKPALTSGTVRLIGLIRP